MAVGCASAPQPAQKMMPDHGMRTGTKGAASRPEASVNGKLEARDRNCPKEVTVTCNDPIDSPRLSRTDALPSLERVDTQVPEKTPWRKNVLMTFLIIMILLVKVGKTLRVHLGQYRVRLTTPLQ